MDDQSVISYSPCSSVREHESNRLAIKPKKAAEKRVLEEEEYLDRMGKIIRRDFFPGSQIDCEDNQTSSKLTHSSECFPIDTPGTEKTSTSSTRSRKDACNMRLNAFLDKYTSEDNAYFDKLQKNDQKKHRTRYPWLYKDIKTHNKLVRDQLKLPSSKNKLEVLDGASSETKMIDWPHNPKNSLFYTPKDPETDRKSQTIINYKALRGFQEPIFKEPIAPRGDLRRTFNTFTDKIGIDGKLVNAGNDTPSINGYSFVPPPESPSRTNSQDKSSRTLKADTDRFYIPSASAREELANRIYEEKVAKKIRTPKVEFDRYNRTPGSSLRTPSSDHKSYAEFSFSPERVSKTPKRNH